MPSSCAPEDAPAGDVDAALMVVDSRLRAIYDGATETSEQREMVDRILGSLREEGVEDLLDGACTLVFVYMKWLRMAYEDHGKDVIECVVPDLVAMMRNMPRSIRPEAIPTMSGLLVAAATGLSPSLWRRQYGAWTEAEMNALEFTAFFLAERINHHTGDHDFATRMVTEALSRTED
ncbi:hypothetical protein [Streptomyces sp. NPDC048172]|uniref:hypothetical protein n=1 Tax=Streptomyces sp. NPDC048172 TaxID=3365505 RepID=UPI00372176AE